MASFEELVGLMARLRSEDGCPWDREQTIDDFRKHLANESREALEAIEKRDYENLCEELGDLMWHILFISEIAKEEGLFTVEDVMSGLKDKMIRRHPHVFGDAKYSTSEEVVENWDKIKAAEKRG